MDLQLQGKHALITGGSKGIGLACARGFLEEGASVTLVARNAFTLEAARVSLIASIPSAAARIGVVSADLKDPAAAVTAIDHAEQDFGPVHILVNSAGAARRTPPDELTPQHWRDAMDAKYFTYVNVIDPLIKRMASRGSGVVLNVVGTGGKVATLTHMAGGAANAALMLITAGLAAAYGPRGVRVNAVNPSLTLTERMEEGLEADARLSGITKEEALTRASARMPLGRVATAGEIATVPVFAPGQLYLRRDCVHGRCAHPHCGLSSDLGSLSMSALTSIEMRRR